MLRTLAGAAAGILTATALSFAVEGLQLWLMPAAFNTSFAGRVIIVMYTLASAFYGGYVAGWVGRGFRAAWVMAVVQTALGIMAWASMPDFAPTWVWLSMIVVGPAVILWGGRRATEPEAGLLSSEVHAE